jgi:hypothetical protein
MYIVANKSELRCAGIYAIENILGVCKYVGQSNHIGSRWRGHICALRKGDHFNPRLQYVWNGNNILDAQR